MDIISFLNKYNILWQPIILNNKVPLKLDNGIQPKVDDYKNLSKEEIIKRQKNYTKSDYIAIFTDEIQQIDIDQFEAIEKYSFLKDSPYFESINKKFPHYFVKIDDYKGERSEMIGGDILTGQWAYCKRNVKVVNAELPLCSFKLESFDFSLIKKNKLNDLIEKLREEITPDTNYKTWSLIIQNLFNVASFHLFLEPHKFCHNFSKDSVKYNEEAITKINNLKRNNYSAQGSLDYLKKSTQEVKKKLEFDELEQQVLDLFYERNQGLIFYCNEALWMKDSTFVWRSNKETVKQQILQWLYINYPKLSIDNKNQYKKYIFDMASMFCKDEKFKERFNTSTIGKLCFINGVLDISTRKFNLWGTPETINVFTKVHNLYNYRTCNPIIKKELMDRVFNPIFNDNQELIKEHLCCISRALYCHIDKYYSVWVGVRNSGKGVLTKLYTKALNAYVSSFDANNLIKKKGNNNNNETSKANGWKIPFCEYRLVIGNEMTIDSKSCVDGNQLKQIASGGDEITTRVNYGFDIIHKVIGHLILFQNDLPDIHPKDAYQTMLYVDMPCAFQTEESDLAIRRDPDINIKDFIQNEEVYLALIDLLLDNYGAPNYSLMISQAKGMQEEETESEFQKVKSLFNITTNKDDFLSVKEIDEVLSINNISLTNVCRNRYLNQIVEPTKIKGKRCFRYIKRKEPVNEEFGL